MEGLPLCHNLPMLCPWLICRSQDLDEYIINHIARA